MEVQDVDTLAQTIWDYSHMNQELKKADCILALCSLDTRVAERAARLFLDGYAPYLLFSGGVGKLTEDIFTKPEAEVFADVATQLGVPKESILIESRSTNTGENVQFSKALLAERGLNFSSFILVQKPYMERRTYATFMKVWPGMDFTVTSPQISYASYPTKDISKEKVINIMVGDMQRIREYPAKGFQIPQEIPVEVWGAYEKLVAAGFNKHLIRES